MLQFSHSYNWVKHSNLLLKVAVEINLIKSTKHLEQSLVHSKYSMGISYYFILKI